MARHGFGASMIAALVVAAAGPAGAAGDPEAAMWIVEGLCSTCHQLPGQEPPENPPAGPAPSFQSIADQPDVYTHDRLTAFLTDPHYPMDRFQLSPEDVANLVAYIESLQPPAERARILPRER